MALPQIATDIETPICTQEQQNDFLSTLPNAAVCGASLETVSSPPLHHSQLLDILHSIICVPEIVVGHMFTFRSQSVKMK